MYGGNIQPVAAFCHAAQSKILIGPPQRATVLNYVQCQRHSSYLQSHGTKPVARTDAPGSRQREVRRFLERADKAGRFPDRAAVNGSAIQRCDLGRPVVVCDTPTEWCASTA